MIVGSGININSTVSILTTCIAVQVTEMKTIIWKMWEEPSFYCIFGHGVSLSQVQLLAVPLNLQEAYTHAADWRSWWMHLNLELICCDVAERPSLNTEFLSF